MNNKFEEIIKDLLNNKQPILQSPDSKGNCEGLTTYYSS